MTTISFTVPKTADVNKIIGILKIFEVEDITTTNEKLPNYVVEGVEKGIQEIKEGKGISSMEVHKRALKLCTK